MEIQYIGMEIQYIGHMMDRAMGGKKKSKSYNDILKNSKQENIVLKLRKFLRKKRSGKI